MSENASRIIDWLLAASFVLSLIAYGYLGSYSRYMADDYNAVRMVRTHGLRGAQIASYNGWTGALIVLALYRIGWRPRRRWSLV